MTVRMHTTIEYPCFCLCNTKMSQKIRFLCIEAILSHFVVNSRQLDVQMYKASLENLCRKTNKARESVFYLLALNSWRGSRESGRPRTDVIEASASAVITRTGVVPERRSPFHWLIAAG